tara:strand:- start:43 stop:387 length:345 start_codon:yes stop_codon:yes gene_type:complete
MKKLLLLPLILCGSVHAEPYINLEMNRIYPKGSYVTTQYEVQIGYRKVNEKSSWYTTIGPVLTDVQFNDGLIKELGGFIGGDIQVNDDVTLYGELFASTDETVILKTGTTIAFQ